MLHRHYHLELFGLEMSFCPKWVFEAACSAAAAEYLSRQLDLNTVANGYAAVLSEFYQPINPQEVAGVIEQMLRFLDELDAGETAAPLATGFAITKFLLNSRISHAS